MAPTLAIVIVSYNARADLDRCLRALADAPPATPHQIVVVDNGSSDGSTEAVGRDWPATTLIALGRNVGYARANNEGIRATRSEFVLVLNSDTVVPAGAIDRLVDDLRRHPDCAIAGPRLVDAAGRPEISFGGMIGLVREVVQKLRGRLYEAGCPPVVRHVERWTSRAHHPDWVTGACLLARRGDLEAVGLFDERFFLYTEDVDLCAAVRARGRRVRFTPVAEVVHLRGASRRHDAPAAEAAYRQSQLVFYAKHHPWSAIWLRAYLRLTGRVGKTARS